MTDELVYDPRTKQMIKDHLYDFLYAPVVKDFKTRLKTIITRNSILHGNDQEWVAYKGEYYGMDDHSKQTKPVNRLKVELRPLMDEYLKDLEYLNKTELPYVLGFINQVLNSSNSVQDYFRIFPESTHRPIKNLIEKCGCRTEHLEDGVVIKLKKSNEVPIELMKKRMVLNLLI